MLLLSLVVVTRNPDNQTICVNDTAVMNCGYYSTTGHVTIPLANINNTLHISWIKISPPIAGLPLQFIVTRNDTNASRIIIGPVGEQFVGSRTNFSCVFNVRPSYPSTPTVVLTVLGE